MCRHNLKLRDCLDQNPSAYLGMTVPDFPNFFFIFGPNTVLAHSSVIWMIECQVEYIVQTITSMANLNIRSVLTNERPEFGSRDLSSTNERPLFTGQWTHAGIKPRSSSQRWANGPSIRTFPPPASPGTRTGTVRTLSSGRPTSSSTGG